MEDSVSSTRGITTGRPKLRNPALRRTSDNENPDCFFAKRSRVVHSSITGTFRNRCALGFAVQLQVIQQVQRDQAERIAGLERENAELKGLKSNIIDILDRVQALERHNTYLAARRRELVAQLNNLRTLHQEADNSLPMCTVDMQPDNVEGMLGMYVTMVGTAMNHHQRALGQMHANGQFPAYVPSTSQGHAILMPSAYRHAYPPAYSEQGYCYAHNMPYCCRICSK